VETKKILTTQRRKLVVGFVGRKKSGKDTAAVYTADVYERENELGTVTAFFAFADYLKKMTNDLLGISQKEADFLKVHPDIKVQGGYGYRDFLNHFGDILKSRFGKLIFTDKLVDGIIKTINEVPVDLILVTDIRYPHEMQALAELCAKENMDFISIKLINTNLPEIEPDAHESESLSVCIPTDYEIHAKNTKEIRTQIEEIYNEYIQ